MMMNLMAYLKIADNMKEMYIFIMKMEIYKKE